MNVKFTKKYTETLPNIMFDKAKIQQVFVNILLNAVESMEGQGELIIETQPSADGKYININFTDTGYGIKKENMKKIFDPFFSAVHKPQSTGLGLSISYGIIKKHRGNIRVLSEVGLGSTFIISLPIGE